MATDLAVGLAVDLTVDLVAGLAVGLGLAVDLAVDLAADLAVEVDFFFGPMTAIAPVVVECRVRLSTIATTPLVVERRVQ